ncbi:hypothetical protein GGR56DRAFT_667703 [Xylariaceae sp. FL0804]|nr:hypothetical protein GGR56DRAFT_667703 [Xylariaceae sp. FL0804]
MSKQPVATPSGPHGTVRARPTLRSTSQSPSRPPRLDDDLLSRLTPATALATLQSPTGALQACLRQASASEQALARRAALASRRIHDWLDELTGWPWPSESGSNGFEVPTAKRRKLFDSNQPRDDREGTRPASPPSHSPNYLGSLPADDVARYDRRVEQILQELEELNVDEIKNQVLHNHILPLSRPGTPFSDSGRSAVSSFSYAKMEDMTAVITAVTVQALPQLTRLTRLLNTWNVRLAILRQVPALLGMIADAELALQSAWKAIDLASRNNSTAPGESAMESAPSYLSRKDYHVINSVLQQRVSKPGRGLDFMLDSLEGMIDTLPEEWLDRMEDIERDYAEWVTIAEHQVQKGEWATVDDTDRRGDSALEPEPETPRPRIQVQEASPQKEAFGSTEDDQPTRPGTPFDYSSVGSVDISDDSDSPRRDSSPDVLEDTLAQGPARSLVEKPRGNIPGSTSQVINLSSITADQNDVHSGVVPEKPSLQYDTDKPNSESTAHKLSSVSAGSAQPSSPRTTHNQTYDGYDDSDTNSGRDQDSPVLSPADHDIVRPSPTESSEQGEYSLQPALEDDFEPSVLESVNEEDEEEPELPPTRAVNRKESHVSFASTVICPSSELVEQPNPFASREGSLDPDLPRLHDPNDAFSSDAISPPSSPPLRYKPSQSSANFKDGPEVASVPEAGTTPPRTPLAASEIFDPDTSFEWESQLGSPSRMSTISSVSEDDHLHKQIRGVLENIPAKIALKKTSVNLNPPGFELPSRQKGAKSDTARPRNSSLSSRVTTPSLSRSTTPSFSRSGTPSFMLAPAREARPRSRSSGGIRVYHLSSSKKEPPMKLFIRCVGENNERVMVRVGGGWADLAEYLRDYASHHSRRSKGEGKVEVQDAPATGRGGPGSSPPSRPGSALDAPMTPLAVRKTRRSLGEEGPSTRFPKTPVARGGVQRSVTPNSGVSARSRESSQVNWDEEDSSLGLAGPSGARGAELSDESRAWVESVKEKVRVASSGERIAAADEQQQRAEGRLGELGRVGGTKRLFRKN